MVRTESYKENYRNLKKLKSELGRPSVKYTYDTLNLGGPPEKEQIYISKQLKIYYILHCLLKISIEVTFLYFNYILQMQQSQNSEFGFFIFGDTWHVPEKYFCQTENYRNLKITGVSNENIRNVENFRQVSKNYLEIGQFFGDGSGRSFEQNGGIGACNQQIGAVTCWVSRPYEKTFILKYMIALDYISILVTVFEIVEILWNLRGNGKRRSNDVSRNGRKHRFLSGSSILA